MSYLILLDVAKARQADAIREVERERLVAEAPTDIRAAVVPEEHSASVDAELDSSLR